MAQWIIGLIIQVLFRNTEVEVSTLDRNKVFKKFESPDDPPVFLFPLSDSLAKFI